MRKIPVIVPIARIIEMAHRKRSLGAGRRRSMSGFSFVKIIYIWHLAKMIPLLEFFPLGQNCKNDELMIFLP